MKRKPYTNETATPPRAGETTVDTENRLIGEWIAEQREAGKISVSMSELDTVRSGIRLALG